jgi:propane monooxygenase reductase subunit
MVNAAVHKVRFEPVGVDMDVMEGETVLDAAFRQGITLMHGCKEGQCASCKARLVDGDIELTKYSTFALSDGERETDHILLCRTLAYSDITVELLSYDEELMHRSIAVKSYQATLTASTALTHDIRLLTLSIDAPLRFWAGQFIIKKYSAGAFSSLLDGGLAPGAPLIVKGPYGTCFRRENRPGPLLLIGGGSGMSPLWSILHDHINSGEQRPIRFFYGARTRLDLFHLEQFAALEKSLPDFRFIPALSHADDDDAGWAGERGFVHEVLQRSLHSDLFAGEVDAYSCGPTPMIDAVLPVLQLAGVEPEHIHLDKFTPALR